MDEDHRELANRLFATAMLEDAVKVAVSGQSRRLNASQLADADRQLQAAARNIAIVVEAAIIVAETGVNRSRIGGNARAERAGHPARSKHALERFAFEVNRGIPMGGDL